MKLTKNDKDLLKKWGFRDDDIPQIEEATGKTIYTVDDKRISTSKAIEVLGREVYLSGIARSAFHWSAVRKNEKDEEVYFNSSRLFKC